MNQDFKKSRDYRADFDRRLKSAIRESQVAQDMFEESYCRFMGVNRTDGRCLDIIDRHTRVTAGQLAQEAGLTTGAVTAVIDRLEKAGYVQRARDAADRRKVWIEPTPLAGELGARIFGHYAQTTPLLFARFSQAEMQAILDFLVVGQQLNRAHAQLMDDHLGPASSNAETRLAQASRYEHAAEACTRTLLARVIGAGTE